MSYSEYITKRIDENDIIIVGCGLSGCVMAERFANVLNKKVLIMDKRNHIGGNCYDYKDDNNILIGKYGAHIFHTDNKEVWDYVNMFDEWVRWEHKVVAKVDDKYVPIPVNITTVNMIFDKCIKTEDEMNEWLTDNKVNYDNISNSEQMAKSRVGNHLYEKMFRFYTFKQWNKFPEELSPEVLSRIPVRNNFDIRYFTDRYQALPKYGYTHFFGKILNNPNISIELNCDFFEHYVPSDKTIIYTGPIDRYFSSHGYPSLEYRSIRFEIESHKNMNYYQSNSVINYPCMDTDFTRIVEYKHFLNQESPHTTIVKEYTTSEGEPYYPVPTASNLKLYELYKELADKESSGKNIHFIGRLANYKYFNMDQAIENSLKYFEKLAPKYVTLYNHYHQ